MKYHIRKFAITFGLLLTILCSTPCFAAKKIVLSGMYIIRSEIVLKILREAYSNLGMEIEFKEYPILRSTHYAHTGSVDGEIFKVNGVDKKYPNLIKIPVPLDTLELMVLTRKNSPLQATWPSLHRASIGYFRGIFFIERQIETQNITNAKTLETNEQLIKMVSLGRLEAGLIARITGVMLLQKNPANNVMLHKHPIAATPVYHYLNKKHADLVPQLTEILHRMKENGRMKEIRRSVLKQHLGTSF